MICRLMLPYQENKCFHILRSMKRYVHKLLQEHTKLEITFTDKKITLCFSTKIETSFEHQHGLKYYVNCTGHFVVIITWEKLNV